MKNILKLPLLSIIISLFIIGLKPTKLANDIPSESLTPYIEEFAKNNKDIVSMEEINKYLTISYGDLNNSNSILENRTIGLCSMPFFGSKGSVTIDSNFWLHASTERKNGLILHEMAHCACTITHVVEIYELEDSWFIKFLHRLGIKTARDRQYLLSDGCPKSIMFPYLPEAYCISNHWDTYVKEISDKCRPWALTTDNIFGIPKHK